MAPMKSGTASWSNVMLLPCTAITFPRTENRCNGVEVELIAVPAGVDRQPRLMGKAREARRTIRNLHE